jgi:hypothetical protein
MAAPDAELQVTLRRGCAGQLDAADETGSQGTRLGRPATRTRHGNDQSDRDDRPDDEST